MAKFFAVINVLGLICGVVGGLLLFCSLPLKKSNYQLTETSDHRVAFCLNGKLIASGYGGPLGPGDEPCPPGGVTPVIEADRPAFVPWGLSLIIVGFVLQVPSAVVPIKS